MPATRRGAPNSAQATKYPFALPTTAGDLWLKCSTSGGQREAALVVLLRERLGLQIPDIVCADAATGWFLMRDAGRPIARDGTADAIRRRWTAILEQYGQMQRR